MENLTENARKFLAHKPELVGIVAGYKFYEHPLYGDEHPLVVITPGGRKKSSFSYDLPTVEEGLFYA